MSLLQATVTQAGGRESEGYFTVVFRSKEPLPIPLIQSAAAEKQSSPKYTWVEANDYAQIQLKIIPLLPGKYTFDVYVLTDEVGYEKKRLIAQDVCIIECEDLQWAEKGAGLFNIGERYQLDLDENLEQRWLSYHSTQHAQYNEPPPERKVLVHGEAGFITH